MSLCLRYSLIAVCLLLAAPALRAQDTTRIKKGHSPKKATGMSAMVPGLGQAYNKKYWKIPIIYAGFAGLGYLAKGHIDKFNTYKEAYALRVDGDSTTTDQFTGIYTDANLLTLKDFYQRNRDLTFIVMAGLYILNIIDAHVDAHLYNFDISDNLSIRIKPDVGYTALPLRPTGGIRLILTL